jgi:hypothetical protein
MYTISLLTLISTFSAGIDAICSHNTHLFNSRAEVEASYSYTGMAGSPELAFHEHQQHALSYGL